MMCGGAAQSHGLLLILCLRGILAGDWSVHLPAGPICAVSGSSVVLPCSYDFPQSPDEGKEVGPPSSQGGGGQQYKVLSEMWCLEDSRCITPSYVFHSGNIFVDPSYQNRVEYLGQPGTKNCSLKISDLRQSDSGTYVFYLITSHPTQKMPEQSGVQLLVADSSAVSVSASRSSDLTEGAALRLACCSPAADPQAQFRWYKSTNSRPRHSGQVWDMSEVTSDVSGSYYCQIQTGNTEQKSAMLRIDVEYSPRNTAVSVSPSGELQEGLNVTLTCSSDANPPVQMFTWYQDAACVPTADKSFHKARQSLATPTGSDLTLSSASITTGEYGQHCCVARNKHGSQTYSVTVKSSRENSTSSGGRVVIIGVTVAVLLALIALVAYVISRKRRSSRRHSYVLTETNTTTRADKVQSEQSTELREDELG